MERSYPILLEVGENSFCQSKCLPQVSPCYGDASPFLALKVTKSFLAATE